VFDLYTLYHLILVSTTGMNHLKTGILRSLMIEHLYQNMSVINL